MLSEIVIDVRGSSVTFDLPEDLHNNGSLQLIWSKDSDTQCVCPPVAQFMAKCACNIDNMNTNNTITISDNHTVTVTNFTGKKVSLYFVSVSTGCGGICNQRSTEQIFILRQGSYVLMYIPI